VTLSRLACSLRTHGHRFAIGFCFREQYFLFFFVPPAHHEPSSPSPFFLNAPPISLIRVIREVLPHPLAQALSGNRSPCRSFGLRPGPRGSFLFATSSSSFFLHHPKLHSFPIFRTDRSFPAFPLIPFNSKSF